MKTIVIKIPGSGAIIDKSVDRHFYWYGNYRNNKIDNKYYESLSKDIINLSRIYHVCIIPGGIGAFLYINFAKDLCLNPKFQKEIGLKSFNIIGDILLSFLESLDANVYSQLVDISELDSSLFSNNRILMMKGSIHCQSSDTLASYAASKLKATLVYLKNDVPVYHVGFPEPTKVLSFDIDDLIKKSSEYESMAGNHYFLDLKSLIHIKENKISTYLINKFEAGKIEDYLNGTIGDGIGCTILNKI